MTLYQQELELLIKDTVLFMLIWTMMEKELLSDIKNIIHLSGTKRSFKVMVKIYSS